MNCFLTRISPEEINISASSKSGWRCLFSMPMAITLKGLRRLAKDQVA
jgi:hypothetical protein